MLAFAREGFQQVHSRAIGPSAHIPIGRSLRTARRDGTHPATTPSLSALLVGATECQHACTGELRCQEQTLKANSERAHQSITLRLVLGILDVTTLAPSRRRAMAVRSQRSLHFTFGDHVRSNPRLQFPTRRMNFPP